MFFSDLGYKQKNMGRYSSYPRLYDEVRRLTIKDLKLLGYLEPNSFKTGVISWSRYGNKTASITIQVDTIDNNIRLVYTYNNSVEIDYYMDLETIPSNLGRGKIWYFVCPETLKRCKVLYGIGSKFLHRTAFKGCYYESQTKSNNALENYFKLFAEIDKMESVINGKYYKQFYKGKYTKHYRKYMQLLKRVQTQRHLIL